MLSVDGLITGIDTEAIITGLLEIQQRQIDQLESRRQSTVSQQTALKTLEARVAGLRSQASRLGRSSNSPFSTRKANVSDEAALIATTSSRAAPGVYDLRINSLAQAHQVATQSYSDLDAEITQGTFTVRMGSRPEASLTIDATNNTLQGLADEINGANAGIAATIVQDGTGGYRLLLTAAETGEANAITITNGLAASGGGAVQPAFDLGNPVQQALNASVTLGTGSGAITVQSETNEISGLIEGVTLNVLEADPAHVVRLRIERDSATAQTAVEDFVESFNDLMSFIDTQTDYNAETQTAGILQGNRAVLDIQQELRSAILDVVPGTSTRLNRLTALGISVGDDGKLVVNQARLSDVLGGRVEGVSEDDVRRLFALDGTSTNTGISFLLGSSRTKDSTTPYEVDVTQAAERASIAAGGALGVSTTIDGTNDQLSLSVDGQALDLTITHGDYTAQQLADLLELLVNDHPDMIGRELRVGLDGGNLLTLTSLAFGSASNVTVSSGSALAALGMTAGQTDTGVDVVGRFIVNGQIETAVGRGRVLTGDSDNDNTADLQVQVTLSPAQILGGSEGTVTVTRGVASRLDQALNRLLNAETGKLSTVNQRFEETIESLQSSIDRQNAAFELQQQRLIEQFTALETAMSQLQSTSSFLSGQLAGIASLGNLNQ
jgi:flagellar hook-associated protein 2